MDIIQKVLEAGSEKVKNFHEKKKVLKWSIKEMKERLNIVVVEDTKNQKMEKFEPE